MHFLYASIVIFRPCFPKTPTRNWIINRFMYNLKSDTGIIFHQQKIFKQNGTFETLLALETKQNRFHHKVVNNKKIARIFFRLLTLIF